MVFVLKRYAPASCFETCWIRKQWRPRNSTHAASPGGQAMEHIHKRRSRLAWCNSTGTPAHIIQAPVAEQRQPPPSTPPDIWQEFWTGGWPDCWPGFLTRARRNTTFAASTKAKRNQFCKVYGDDRYRSTGDFLFLFCFLLCKKIMGSCIFSLPHLPFWDIAFRLQTCDSGAGAASVPKDPDAGSQGPTVFLCFKNVLKIYVEWCLKAL